MKKWWIKTVNLEQDRELTKYSKLQGHTLGADSQGAYYNETGNWTGFNSLMSRINEITQDREEITFEEFLEIQNTGSSTLKRSDSLTGLKEVLIKYNIA